MQTLISFNGTNGAYPQTPLVQSSDGSLYGTTARGGIYDDGTVFKINSANLAPFPALTCAGGTVASTWNARAGQRYQLQFNTRLSDTGWANLGNTLTASNESITLTDSVIQGTGQRFYRLVLLP